MTRLPPRQSRVLSIDPYARGFGFVILEGPGSLIDWGTKESRGNKATRCLRQITELFERYQPDVFVVEDCTDKGCRRCLRVQVLIRDIADLAAGRNVTTQSFSLGAVRSAFLPFGAVTKQQIAETIATQFPELALRQPPARRPWMSEDERMSIFDAAAFALTFFHVENNR